MLNRRNEIALLLGQFEAHILELFRYAKNPSDEGQMRKVSKSRDFLIDALLNYEERVS